MDGERNGSEQATRKRRGSSVAAHGGIVHAQNCHVSGSDLFKANHDA